MAAKKQHGDMGDPFGDDPISVDVPLRKATDEIDWDRFFKALEILDQRARRMNKAQLYKLQYRLGGAVRAFQAEVMKYISRPRTPGIHKKQRKIDAFGEEI